MTHPLAGQVAIVTGAGRGIGRAIARGLVGAGASVVAIAARQTGELESLAAELGEEHLVPVLADVTKEEDCTRVAVAAVDRFGGIDILVNNAGRGMRAVNESFPVTPVRFWEIEPDDWRLVVDTNVNGPFLMARAVVPIMLAARHGRIVNVSVNHETMHHAGFSPYGPSKAALEAESAIWAHDLAGTGVTVNVLTPGGPVRTGMIPPGVSEAVRAQMLDPTIMVPPLLWLTGPSAGDVSGRRFIASRWRSDLPPEKAAALAADNGETPGL
ncbi:SDR family oxidoreductase [Rhodovastum atsumiense]|uniref:SDR family oxidoreductase n=1 Tax=Rhodovastum atsumiense TaxID=504468 RepID=A0A5M6IXP2_9PROT|nr:SDR family oxidoreductase [Rhodovastum atsumiense]KAA5613114.1 SDR family oxidoreductase [Rhodovastum atsumiense]CAH2600015.1 SDR family oxidoreductase [Rhodovastum atsumiense]